MCSQKVRWMDKDTKSGKLAFYIYQTFHSRNYRGTKQKTYADFAKSNLYGDFLKFAKYLDEIHAINPKEFIDFVLRNSVKLSDWQKPKVYERYVRELNKKESADAAVERNILLMKQWADETGERWEDFFRKINPNRAVMWIQSGRISPWMIFVCSSAGELFDRLTEEQVAMVHSNIDPDFWNIRLARDADTVRILQEEFDAVGI